MIEELLKKYNLKYEELKPAEKETLNVWLEAIQKGQLTLDKVKQYIASMKSAVEMELSKAKLDSREDSHLKARLRNYILLEAFLSTPERAKQELENVLSNIGRG